MSVPLSTVLSASRAYLNDTNQTVWTDAALIPLAQEAHRELQSELWQIGSPLVRGQSACVVPASSTSNVVPFNLIPADSLTNPPFPPGDFISLGFQSGYNSCPFLDLTWTGIITSSAASGQTSVVVNSANAFAAAQFVIIDPNTVLQEIAAIISISTLTLTVGSNLTYTHAVGAIVSVLPPDLLVPTSMAELTGGIFQPMTECSYFPQSYAKQASSNYWSWQQEHLLVPCATTSRTYLIQYRRQIRIPALNTDLIGILFGEMYLGPRTAGIAAGTLGNGDAMTALTALAKENFAKVVSANRGQQKPPLKP